MPTFIPVLDTDATPLDASAAARRLSSIDPTDSSFLQLAANVLRGLYNNRALFDSVVSGALAGNEAALKAFYTPQSMILGSGTFRGGATTFVLRANMWFPKSRASLDQELEDRVFSVGNCHNHNFSFLTIGYLGPGYRTDLYRCEPSSIVGVPDEPATLISLGSTTLAPGSVLYFEKHKDVHIQRHPEALSVSINILVDEADVDWTPQYEFSPIASTVTSTIYSKSMRQASLAILAAEFGAEKAARLLWERLSRSPMWQHRHSAGRGLLKNGAATSDELEEVLDLPKAITLSRDDMYLP
jgi:hypothetical protein